MAKHVKPTKEELKEKIKESQKKLDELKNKPTPSATPSPSPSKSVPSASPSATPSPSETELSASVSPSATPSPSKSNGSPSASPSPSLSEEDEKEKLKKKAKSSSVEAQVLHSRTKKYDAAVEEAENVKEPDDSIMIQKYGKAEWDVMSDGQRMLAKENWVNSEKLRIMTAASKEGRDVEKWLDKVNEFIENPKTFIKYPVLEGKTDDFKLFAIKPTRRGLDFEDLVLAFKGELSDKPPKKNKGKMFETGTPGRKDKPHQKDGKISALQGRALRKTDFKQWKKLAKAGKIKTE